MEIHKRENKERFYHFKIEKNRRRFGKFTCLVIVKTETGSERHKPRAVDEETAAAITQSCHVYGKFFDRMY